MKPLAIALAFCLLWLPLSASAETRLLMAEEAGCMWCERWNREIAHIYPKTDEGQTAPLLRFDIRDGAPEDVTLESRVVFTPTFILVEDGDEVGRIEGYSGEHFFWGLLSMMFERAGVDVEPTG